MLTGSRARSNKLVLVLSGVRVQQSNALVEAYCSTQRNSAQLPFVFASSLAGYDSRVYAMQAVQTLRTEAVLPLVVEFEVRSLQFVHMCATAHKGFPPEVAARVGLTVLADNNWLLFSRISNILHAREASLRYIGAGQPGRRSRGGTEELSH